MQEPAWKYEEDDDEPVTRPRLEGIAGGGETSEPKRGHLRVVGDSPAPADEASPEQLQAAESAGETPSEAATKGAHDESGQLADAVSGIPYREEAAGKFGKLRSRVSNVNRRQAMLGGGVLAGVISLIIVGIMSFLPLKLVHIVENLQNRFFASSESAVEKYTEKLLNRYVNEHVLTALKKPGCTSTRVNKNCVDPIVGEGKVERLFRTWREHKLEEKFATKYGIEFGRTGNPNDPSTFKYFLKAPGVATVDIDFDINGSPVVNFDDMPATSKNQIRLKVREALEGETRYKRMFYRFRVGMLLERKYGIKRCAFACEGRDKLQDWTNEKIDRPQKAAKMLITRRIIEPRSELLGFAFGCIISGCDDAPASDPNDPNDTQRRDAMERKVKEYLDRRSIEYTQDTVTKIVDSSINIIDNGVTGYIIEKLTNETFKEVAGKSIPVIGWIHGVATTIKRLAEAGPKIKRWAFVLGSTAMVSHYMLARTLADEQKAGDTRANLVGSFVSALGDDTKNGESAESSPLYADIFQADTNAKSTAFNIFSPRALAATSPVGNSSPTSKYTCDNGDPVDPKSLICPEESLVANNFLTDFSKQFNGGPLSSVKTASDLYLNSLGRIVGVIQNTPGSLVEGALNLCCSFAINPLKDAIADKSQAVATAVAEKAFPSALSANMSGARNVNGIIGGADVAGNVAAQYGIGGKRVTSAQIHQIRTEMEQERRFAFSQKPFFARMFDTESTYSLASQTAMAVPLSKSVAVHNSVTSFLNPLATFASMFSRAGTVSAAEEPSEDPFGIPQFAYDTNGEAFNRDPKSLTDEYCKRANKEWAEGTGEFAGTLIIDEDTGMDIHTKENPCMLLDAVIGSAGGLLNEDLLPASDRSTSSGPTSGNTVAGPQIVGDIFEDSRSVECAPGTIKIDRDIEGYREGNKVLIRLCALPNMESTSHESIPGDRFYVEGANGKALVNSRVSGAWFALVEAAKKDGVNLKAASTFRTYEHQDDLCGGTCDGSLVARPGFSPHQMGLAIDFAGTDIKGPSSTSCSQRARDPGNPTWEWLYRNAERFGFKQYTKESWHWDPLNTVSRCGSAQ